MSKFKTHASKKVVAQKKYSGAAVENFMAGISYELNPLDTLKIVSASSIFGEPSYYRKGAMSKSGLKEIDESYREPDKSTADIFTQAIRNSLDYNFAKTLELAAELRRDYFMRLNPAIIFIEAALHEKRAKFNEDNPLIMKNIGKYIAMRPDDLTNQFEYYMYLKGSKNQLPNIVKRTWAEKLSEYNRYQISKYQSKSLRDLVRISHAHSDVIDELMKLQKGTLPLDETETVWERLRSEGKSWKEILGTITIPHMALLRNLRGIFTEVNEKNRILTLNILNELISGVKKGKQFPYRYYTAMKYIKDSECHNIPTILETLENCMDEAMSNFPTLMGTTICLSDNSGSAHGALISEYGSTKISEIDNLSSVMTAMNSENGYVGIFGDGLTIIPITKRNGVLAQTEKCQEIGKNIGHRTENGIWIFFRDALANKSYYDNIFIYSDQQAGHGGLYGIDPREYKNYISINSHGAFWGARDSKYIDVMKLVDDYRNKVNPKVNVFSIQTAGYDNSVLPENYYRSAILTGWTGKETLFAKRIIDIWNGIEQKKAKKN